MAATNSQGTLPDTPFASASPELKQAYGLALAAYTAGDYDRARLHINYLEQATTLSPEQKQAVQDLLSEVQQAAADTNRVRAADAQRVYALSAPDQDPFDTADFSVSERVSSAKLSLQIGDYDRAMRELSALSTNAHLNWHQKYIVQELVTQATQGAAGR